MTHDRLTNKQTQAEREATRQGVKLARYDKC